MLHFSQSSCSATVLLLYLLLFSPPLCRWKPPQLSAPDPPPPTARTRPGCRVQDAHQVAGKMSAHPVGEKEGKEVIIIWYNRHELDGRQMLLLTFTTLFWPSWGFPSVPTGSSITQYCLLLRVVTSTTPTTSSDTEGMWASLSAMVTSHSSPVRRFRPPASLKGRRARTWSAFWRDTNTGTRVLWYPDFSVSESSKAPF